LVPGSERRAQGTGHRAQGTGHRAQGSGHRAQDPTYATDFAKASSVKESFGGQSQDPAPRTEDRVPSTKQQVPSNMIKYPISIFILASLANAVFSQTNPDLPLIRKGDIKGMKITQIRSFTGESLYGYIDGGADLYLEYGFSDLNVTEFTKGKSKIKAEIWKMNDQESAFGIFSVSRFRCRSHPVFTELACQNKYQLQFCKGNYYVNIINRSGTAADSIVSVTAGITIAGRIAGENVDLKDYFTIIDKEKVLNESIFVKGRLGVNNGVPDLESYFRDTEKISALIISKPEKSVLSIMFNDISSLEKFAVSHKWELIPEKGQSVVMRSGETVFRKDEKQLLIVIPAGSGNGGQN
jgi:hypothetical protein